MRKMMQNGRKLAWLGLLVLIQIPLYLYITIKPTWRGSIFHLEPARPSTEHRAGGSLPHNSSFSDIFFLETGGRGIITARIACAVESASKMHPNWTVHLLSVGADYHARNGSSRSFVNLLASIQNVILSKIEPQREFEGTPLASWYRSGALNKSSYPVQHLADALRLAVLYKRGGVYLDIDVVVMRPLNCLPSFVCQSPAWRGDLVSNGFLGFHHGDPFLLELMNRTSKAYEHKTWGAIGPRLLRKVTLDMCGKRSVLELVGRRCGGDAGFTVLDHRKFLPVRYDKSRVFFAANSSEKAWNLANGSYVMHVYGKVTSKILSEPGSAYRQAAETYCPDSLQLSLYLNGTF